jgi:hypothetical protein
MFIENGANLYYSAFLGKELIGRRKTWGMLGWVATNKG